jgi:hypothetical protein
VSGGKAPPLLTSALDGNEWIASHYGHFYPWIKSPLYPLDCRLDGPQGRRERCGVERICCPCPGSNPGRSASSLALP